MEMHMFYSGLNENACIKLHFSLFIFDLFFFRMHVFFIIDF